MTTQGHIEAKVTVPSGVVVDASNSGGSEPVDVTAGTYYVSAFCSQLQTDLNTQCPGSGGATWTVSLSTTTGLVTIAMSAGTFSITWTTAALGTLLGHSTITTQTSVTGATACHGIWIPDRPLFTDPGADPRIAPLVSNLRETEGPTGEMFGFGGSYRYVMPNLRWAHVSRERTWDTDSGATPSWERFAKNAHLGLGHSWFSPCSTVRILDHSGAYVGSTSSVTGWKMRGVRSVTARRMVETWTGAWLVEIPALVAVGG